VADCRVTTPAPPGRLSILSRSATVSRRSGRFKLSLRCRSTSPCAGRTAISIPVGRRLVTIATGRFRLGAGKRARVNVKMTRAGLRRLRAQRRLTGIVTLTQTGGGAPSRGTVSLRISRR
jgi:hypothetical protein